MPAEGKQFDAGRIPEALRKAGFDAPEVVLSVRGRIVEGEAGLQLSVPGLQRALRLADGDQLSRLSQGQSVRISGLLEAGRESEGWLIRVKSFQFVP